MKDLNNTYCIANKIHYNTLNKITFKNGKVLMLPSYKYFIIRNDSVDTTNFLVGKNLIQIEFDIKSNKWITK